MYNQIYFKMYLIILLHSIFIMFINNIINNSNFVLIYFFISLFYLM